MYRGIKLKPLEVDDYAAGRTIHLPGYTSTSKEKSIALSFAFQCLIDDQVPVIFEIAFKDRSGLFELTDGFSAYPEEGEVLLQDGLKYRVFSNQEKQTKDTN